MSIFGWFKSPQQQQAEAEARIQEARSRRAAYENEQIMRELDGMASAFAPRSPDEARAYHFALDLIRRRGPVEASRIADLVVRNVQMLSRVR